MSATYQSEAGVTQPLKPVQKREVYLDFVRGIAILLALGWHFNGAPTGFIPLDILLFPGRIFGWAGVDIFFVLSGFLIGGLMFKEVAETDRFRPGRFLIRRAFKIWPVLYVYLFLLLISRRYSWNEFLFQNLFHVQNYFVTPIFHLWSLAVEEHFYLFFALLISVLMSARARGLRSLTWILPGILIVCPILRIVALHFSFDQNAVHDQTQFRIDALASGIALAYLFVYHRDKFDYYASKKVALAIAFFCGLAFLGLAWQDKYLIATAGYTVSYLTGGALLLFCYRTGFILRESIPVRVIAWLGIYSYAMYVFQFVLYRVIEAVLKKASLPALPHVGEIFVKYAGAILMAFLITKLIEKPVLALREKLYPSTLERGSRVPVSDVKATEVRTDVTSQLG